MRHPVPALLALACAALFAASPAAAQQGEPGWTGKGELGLAFSKGNTDSQTAVTKVALDRETETWKHDLDAAFLYGKSDGVESAYRYEWSAASGYQFQPRHRLSGSMRNERDHFATNEYQWTAALGYGYDAIANERTRLSFEIGPGYRWAKLQDVRVHNDEVIVRGQMDFSRQLTETTSLFDTLLVESGDENTFVRNDLGLQVKMTDALALKAGVQVRHNTDTLPDTRRTDTLTTVNVVYGF